MSTSGNRWNKRSRRRLVTPSSLRQQLGKKRRLEQLPSTMSPSQKIASLAVPHQLKHQLTQQSQQDQRNQPILPTQQNPPTQQNLPTQQNPPNLSDRAATTCDCGANAKI